MNSLERVHALAREGLRIIEPYYRMWTRARPTVLSSKVSKLRSGLMGMLARVPCSERQMEVLGMEIRCGALSAEDILRFIKHTRLEVPTLRVAKGAEPRDAKADTEALRALVREIQSLVQ